MLKLKHTIILSLLTVILISTFNLDKLKLGLDLKGGSSLLFKAENHIAKFKKDLREELEFVLPKHDILIEDFKFEGSRDEGVSALITLFDAEDAKGAEKIMSEYGMPVSVEGRGIALRYSKEYLDNDLKEKMTELARKVKNRLDQYGLSEPYVIREGLDKIYIELPGVSSVEELNKNIKLIETPANLSFNPVFGTSATPQPGYLKSREGEVYYKLGYKILTGDNIKQANTTFENNSPGVSFKLDAFGAETFADFTEENIGNQLAIVLDGEVLSSPRINSRIGGGQAQITGNYTVEETKTLSISLKSGALPFSIELQETKIIGPSLGEKNIKSGVLSIAAGFGMVLLFLILYYRKNGLIILSALAFNLVLVTLAVYNFGFVLTLPGIAGLILTIGMAIDANIIIQERMKEMDLKGRGDIVKRGYSEAKVAIFDANITTILVGIILYTYGTGPLKSFALLLIVGILTSIYTSIYFTEEIHKNITERKGDIQ